MASALDMSLDDIVKSNAKKSGGKAGRGGRKGGRGGAGPQRRQRNQARSAPYQRQQQQKPVQRQQPTTIQGGLGATSKILVMNLDSQVLEEDVADIFANVGRVKSAIMYHDRSGRSHGTAEVTFYNKRDAMKAVEEYEGAEVDGRPMYIKVVANKAPTVVVPPKPQPRQQQPRSNGNSQRGQGRQAGRG